MYRRLAYMPLITYPKAPTDMSVASTIDMAASIHCGLFVTTYSAEIWRETNEIGKLLIETPAEVRKAEEESKVRCQELHLLVKQRAGPDVSTLTRHLMPELAGEAAAGQARYFDVVLVPWSGNIQAASTFAQSVVFTSGRPSILVPPGFQSKSIEHVAIAWDASRVAARAVADLIPLLASDCRIAVLTVRDEKPLPGQDIAEALAALLMQRGFVAEARHIALAGRTVAEALQEAAIEAGADLLAMGGFGHSRARDFILGGATKGIFADLRLPVLLSH